MGAQRRALMSKNLTALAVNTLLAKNISSSAPAYNYSFLVDQFASPSSIPDLTDQVEAFLAMKPPKSPPKETLWVLSFGTWDIWSLAALPRTAAEEVIDRLVTHLTTVIELLYEQSLDDNSIAFSDFWSYGNSTVLEQLMDTNTTGWVDPREREYFRVMIPELFDISLTPGWHDRRPNPPSPHSKAEQMRNAAYLTMEWNSRVRGAMDSWMRTPDPFVDKEEGEPEPKSLLDYLPYLSRKSPKPDLLTIPFPRRIGVQPAFPQFILDATIEQQLREVELVDHNGLGTAPANSSIRFVEVWAPCSWNESELDAPGAMDKDRDDMVEEADISSLACDVPGDYLWYTPFTVAQRARRAIARLVGATTRAALLMDTEAVFESVTLVRRGSEAGFLRSVKPAIP
jgi:hypothetical protein